MSLTGSTSLSFAQNMIHDFQNSLLNSKVVLSSTNATKMVTSIFSFSYIFYLTKEKVSIWHWNQWLQMPSISKSLLFCFVSEILFVVTLLFCFVSETVCINSSVLCQRLFVLTLLFCFVSETLCINSYVLFCIRDSVCINSSVLFCISDSVCINSSVLFCIRDSVCINSSVCIRDSVCINSSVLYQRLCLY